MCLGRAEARLTQEELAEAAGISPRSVSDLERGISRTARKDTALLLAGALGLAEPVRGVFAAARQGVLRRGPDAAGQQLFPNRPLSSAPRRCRARQAVTGAAVGGVLASGIGQPGPRVQGVNEAVKGRARAMGD